MVAGALWPVRIVSEAFLIASALSAVGFLVTFFTRESYDLGELRQLHDKEQLRAIELTEQGDFDGVQCLACGELYSARFPVCPSCGSSPGRIG